MAGRRHAPIVMSQPEVCHTGRAGHESDSADVCIRSFFLKNLWIIVQQVR